MRFRTRGLTHVAFAAFVLAPASLAAQASNTMGLTLGAHLQGAALEVEAIEVQGIQVEAGDRAGAAGGGVRIGYGVHPNVTLFLQLDGAQFDFDADAEIAGEWTMGHGDLGARFNFADDERSWVPYLLAAITGRVAGVEDATVNGEDVEDVELSGAAFTVGGGLMYYFNESVALDIGLAFSGGEFSEVEIGAISIGSLALDARSSRLSIGITGWP